MVSSQITVFDDLAQEVWVQFDDKDRFFAEQDRFYDILKSHQGQQSCHRLLSERESREQAGPDVCGKQ